MSPWSIALCGLAGWRLALFLVDDNGPFDMAHHLRLLLRAESPYNATMPKTGWEKLWSCMRCMGAWTSLAALGSWQLTPWPVYALAVWAIAHLAEAARRDV